MIIYRNCLVEKNNLHDMDSSIITAGVKSKNSITNRKLKTALNVIFLVGIAKQTIEEEQCYN